MPADLSTIRMRKRFGRLLAAASLFLALAACETSPSQRAAPDGAVILFATVVAGNYEESWLDPSPESLYRMQLTLSRVLDDGTLYDLGRAPLDRAERIDLRPDGADLHWYAFRIPAGTYILRAISESKDWERYGQTDTKLTRFLDPALGPRAPADAWRESAVTPHFTVAEGKVTYIGTFRANLYTTDYGLGSRYLNGIAKAYVMDSGGAAAVTQQFGFALASMVQDDIFDGKYKGKALYEKPWAQRNPVEDPPVASPSDRTPIQPSR